MEPNAVAEEFGVDIATVRTPDKIDAPYVVVPDALNTQQTSRSWLNRFSGAMIEVWDFWYRKPVFKGDKLDRIETWNVVVAGNAVVRGPLKYPEYAGVIPYVPLFNTYIPGVPDGRAELYDIEPIIREKFERITSGSQMIGSGTSGRLLAARRSRGAEPCAGGFET